MATEQNTTESTTDTITLATDTDFAAAESEFNELIAIADSHEDVVFRTCDLHNAILKATPKTVFQASAVLRRLIEPGLGLRGTCSDHHPVAIERVVNLLEEMVLPEEAVRKALWRLVIDLETPLGELREGIDALEHVVPGIRVIGGQSSANAVNFIQCGLDAALDTVMAVYENTMDASRPSVVVTP